MDFQDSWPFCLNSLAKRIIEHEITFFGYGTFLFCLTLEHMKRKRVSEF